MTTTTETKTADELLFGHYLRTGQRLSGPAAAQFLEWKFNQRHYRENGQFARTGEGMSYGGGASSAGERAGVRTRSATARSSAARQSVRASAQPTEEIVVVGDRAKPLREDFDATFGSRLQKPKSPLTTERKPIATIERPSSFRELGSLSAHFETGGRGVSTVSSGIGRGGVPDRGGVSYGSYQLTSQTPQIGKNGRVVILRDGGNVAKFLQNEGEQWAREFDGHRPGSSGFSDVWRRIASRDGAALNAAEHAWVKRENYQPAVNMIRAATGIDVDKAPFVVRDVLWSTAVQHGAGSATKKRGGATKIFIDAIAKTDRTSLNYYGDLIANIYARRASYWPSDRPRYRSEEQNALSRLRRE